MALPSELRNEIYKFTFSHTTSIVVKQNSRPQGPSGQTQAIALTQTSRQLCHETRFLHYHLSTFDIATLYSAGCVGSWLRSLGDMAENLCSFHLG